MSIRWVPRASWLAARSSGDENRWGAVRYGIAVHWTAVDILGRKHILCGTQVRGIQRYHQLSKGWADIAYNYVICSHGYVFVCRGEQSASAANGTTAANQTYPAVCFMSGPHDPLPLAAWAAFDDLRLYLMQRKVGPKVSPHLLFTTTECPGPVIRKACLYYP